MKRVLTLAAFALGLGLLPGTALAQSLMFQYFATLSPGDTYNSRGVPLDDVCAIVRQDRANVYNRGNPDGDEPDGFFTTPERRAMIAGKCEYGRNHHTVSRIRSQFIGFVLVRVYGSGGTVTRVQILEAAG